MFKCSKYEWNTQANEKAISQHLNDFQPCVSRVLKGQTGRKRTEIGVFWRQFEKLRGKNNSVKIRGIRSNLDFVCYTDEEFPILKNFFFWSVSKFDEKLQLQSRNKISLLFLSMRNFQVSHQLFKKFLAIFVLFSENNSRLPFADAILCCRKWFNIWDENIFTIWYFPYAQTSTINAIAATRVSFVFPVWTCYLTTLSLNVTHFSFYT